MSSIWAKKHNSKFCIKIKNQIYRKREKKTEEETLKDVSKNNRKMGGYEKISVWIIKKRKKVKFALLSLLPINKKNYQSYTFIFSLQIIKITIIRTEKKKEKMEVTLHMQWQCSPGLVVLGQTCYVRETN